MISFHLDPKKHDTFELMVQINSNGQTRCPPYSIISIASMPRSPRRSRKHF